jgi:hypothetical protein
MAIITLDGGQSSSAEGGQTLQFFINLIAQQVGGAPDTLITTQLLLVLREFYTKSTAWREILGPYAIQAGVQDVYLNPVDQNKAIQFVLYSYLFPFPTGAGPYSSPTWLAPAQRQMIGGSPQQPCQYYMKQNDHMLLYPVPDQAYGACLYVYAALLPVNSAAVLPNAAFTLHLEAIMSGTLARLYSMPRKNWTDKAEAMKQQKTFRQEILMWRDFVNRGNGPADTAFKFPPFAGRSGSQVLPRASG